MRLTAEQKAINDLFDAYQRLKALGWREPMYCPKDGTPLEILEAGSTGIHCGNYQGDWPTGSWWIAADGDLMPSHPVLCRVPVTVTPNDPHR